jgi:hypothetical protein
VRRFVIGLLVIVAVLAGLDVGARVWAGLWVGDRVREALGVSDRPSVSFGGVLFIPQVLRGRITSATLQSDHLVVGGVSFSTARLTLRDVTFRPADLILHHRGRIDVDDGAGVLGMTTEDLERALRIHGADVSVRFSGGQILVSGGEPAEEVGTSPSVEGGSLVLSGSTASFRLPLPQLGPGIDYGGVAVAGDEALLSLRITRARIEGLVE